MEAVLALGTARNNERLERAERRRAGRSTARSRSDRARTVRPRAEDH